MPTIAEELAAILSAVQRPGDFHASGRIEILAPGIEVEGVGPVALPLLPVQAAGLIAAAERAPYGRGPETLVDTSVRRAWQIGPDRVRIAGKHWPRTIEEIASRAAEGLGVSEKVTAELYKLLIYEEGDFFVSHRDTEKEAGMFATLVLALPSRSSGGELVVRHKGREARLDLACEEPSEIAFAAFYADCVHEVLPVRSGYRVTLVYNLIRRSKGASPEPPNYEDEAAATTALLRRWAEDPEAWKVLRRAIERPVADDEDDEDEEDESDEGPRADDFPPLKLIYPLEHAYTPAELGFSALKGADAAVAGVLAAAAPQAGCDLHLALLTIQESGIAEYTGYSSRRRDEPELEAGEVCDRWEALGDWRRPDGEPSALGALPIEEGEISPPDALDDMAPDEEHFQEATGNEGASFERTYRRAALVLWPGKQVLAIVNQAGLSATLPYLGDLVAKWRSGSSASDSPLRHQALELVEHMLATWPTGHWHPYDSRPSAMAELLPLLTQLGDKKGVDGLVEKLAAQEGHGKADNEAILGALDLFPPDKAAERLQRIVAASAVATPGVCAALLAGAVGARFASKPEKLLKAAAALVEALPGDPASAPKDQYGRSKEASVDADLVANLLRALGAIDAALARRAARHLLAWPRRFGLDKVLIPAMRRLSEAGATAGGEALEMVHAACLAHLRSRIAEPLEAPKDWSRPSDIGCTCEHCIALGRFLADPERPTWSLKAAEKFRSHVEDTIRRARSDVDTRTERRGSPHTLVCTKNQASYERRVAQRKKDLADIATLER